MAGSSARAADSDTPFHFHDATSTTPWLPFHMPNLRRIVLPGKINGAAANIILDSGVGTFVIDEALAARLHLRKTGAARAVGITDTAGGTRVSGLTVDFGAMTLTIADAAAYDLRALSSAMYQPIDALLGRDVFEALYVDLDFANTRLRFCTPGQAEPIPNAAKIALTRSAFGLRTLPVSVAGQPAIPATFDLGADRALYLSADYVAERGLLADRKWSTALSAGVDGASVSRVVVMDRVRVGPYVFRRVPVEIPATWAHRVPAFVGFPIFRRLRLAVDFPNECLFAANDPQLTPQPFRKDRAGFGARRMGDHLEVVYVADGSPAAEAGLSVGDEIVAINGHKLNARYFAHFRQNGSQPAGTHFDFTLATGARRRITLADYY
jgi:hypothetical protein